MISPVTMTKATPLNSCTTLSCKRQGEGYARIQHQQKQKAETQQVSGLNSQHKEEKL